MVPTQHMPGWLQAVADWNPVSAVTAGARQLWDNPNPSASISAWPMQPFRTGGWCQRDGSRVRDCDRRGYHRFAADCVHPGLAGRSSPPP